MSGNIRVWYLDSGRESAVITCMGVVCQTIDPCTLQCRGREEHVGFSPTRQAMVAPRAKPVRCSASRTQG